MPLEEMIRLESTNRSALDIQAVNSLLNIASMEREIEEGRHLQERLQEHLAKIQECKKGICSLQWKPVSKA
jgi:hypothetical protein